MTLVLTLESGEASGFLWSKGSKSTPIFTSLVFLDETVQDVCLD